MRRRIDLNIQELVLEGVAPRDRPRVAAALRGELARQVRAAGLPPGLPGLAGRDLVAGRPLRLPPQGPEAVGRALGGAVYGALAGGRR